MPQLIHCVIMITIWVTLIDAERRAGREDLLGRVSFDVRVLSFKPKITAIYYN